MVRAAGMGRGSLLGLLALAVGCAANVDVRTLRDDAADFSRYRSWSWSGSSAEAAVERPRSLEERELAAIVHDRVRRDFATKGYVYRSEGADLAVDARLEVTREQEVTYRTTAIESLQSLHYSPSFEIQGSQREVTPYERGRLTIRVVDRRRNREVWRSKYEGRFRGSFAPHARAAIERALADLPEARSETPPFDPGAIAIAP